MDLMWLAVFALPTIALMVIAEDMARARGRSVKAWVWLTVLTGPLPLGPVVLYLLGPRAKPGVC